MRFKFCCYCSSQKQNEKKKELLFMRPILPICPICHVKEKSNSEVLETTNSGAAIQRSCHELSEAWFG